MELSENLLPNLFHNLPPQTVSLYLPLTFLISAMISLGSLEDVVFILHVKRRERGFTSPGIPPTLPPSLTALLKESGRK